MVPVTGDGARDWGVVVPLISARSGDTWIVPALPLPETLEDTLAAWAAWCSDPKRRHSERTVTSRLGTIRRMARDVDPMTADGAAVEAWLDGLTVTDNSRATYWAQVCSWYAWLMRTGRRDDNPTATIDGTYRAERGEPSPVSEDDLVAILAKCEDPRTGNVRAYVLLAALAGLRIHEIAKVRGEDVKRGRLRVVGKGRYDTTIPLHPDLVALAETMPSAGWWFPGQSAGSGHVSRVSVGAAIKRAMRRAGLSDDATPHHLRHYYGTAVLTATGDIYKAQKALRHKSITSTQIYAKLADEALAEAIASIGPRSAA